MIGIHERLDSVVNTADTPDWSPFLVAPRDAKPIAPRSIQTLEGIGDRLRAAAFAEIQANRAFLWAAAYFEDAPDSLRNAWRELADAEERHLNSLLRRLEELKISLTERPVSDHLWVSLRACQSAKEFAIYMASAEERGRKAGERFYAELAQKDPITADIFRVIAKEEVEHIALASKYFPQGVDEKLSS